MTFNAEDKQYELEYNSLKRNKDKQLEKLFFEHPCFDPIKEKMNLIDDYTEKPFDKAESSEKCRNNKCGSMRTICYNKVTRGCDEGITVFVFCVDCKTRYIMNS